MLNSQHGVSGAKYFVSDIDVYVANFSEFWHLTHREGLKVPILATVYMNQFFSTMLKVGCVFVNLMLIAFSLEICILFSHFFTTPSVSLYTIFSFLYYSLRQRRRE
ncbi:hypothetical protein ACQJBY_006223 [Aegilops geniculata]